MQAAVAFDFDRPCVDGEARKADLTYFLYNHLPLMERLSKRFQEFVEDPEVAKKVSIEVLPLYVIKSGNGKTIPVFQILLDEAAAGNLEGMYGVFPSSGNSAADAALMAPWFRMKGLIAVVDESIPTGKLGQLALPGAMIAHPPRGKSTIEYAREIGQRPGFVFLDQYWHPGSLGGHLRWTWPHVIKECNRREYEPSIISLALGTTSLYVSAAMALKERWPNLRFVGAVCDESETEKRGARTLKGLQETGFNYQDVGGVLIPCGKEETDDMARVTYQEQFSAGPSFAMSLIAVFQYINQVARAGQIEYLYNDRGEISILTVAMDAIAPYTAGFASSIRRVPPDFEI